jgi:FAD:protein FMN transferase
MTMKRRTCLQLGLGVAATLSGFAHASAVESRLQALQWQERALIGFGTNLWLWVAHRNKYQAEAALNNAVRIIRQIEAQMSLFDNNSAVSRLNRDGYLRHADQHLLRILNLANRIAERSGGDFDCTMQPLWTVWANAKKEGRLPAAKELREVAKNVGWRGLTLTGDSVALARTSMAVSLNGIAQGYAADRVRDQLIADGIEHALLDTGEWLPMGASPGGKPWALALEPAAMRGVRLISDGRALATSSDAHTSFSADHRHHHILDPRSGYSPTHWASVTVAAHSCALADGLTKVMFMHPEQGALARARQWGVDVLLVRKDGTWCASPGMPVVAA